MPKIDTASLAAARRQIAALQAISDSSIPRLIEWREFQSHLWLVMEFRDAVPLDEYIQAHHPLSGDEIKSLVTQLFAAMAVIFNEGFAHLRITNHSLSVEQSGRLNIIDFGYVHPYDLERVDDLYAAVTERYGSDVYTAPEAFVNIKYNARKAVMWSCGVVLYFMCTGQTDRLSTLAHPAFDDGPDTTASKRKLSAASQQALKVPVVTYPDRFAVPSYMRDIISKMLQIEPTRRAELIEVAAKVPKEVAVGKQTRPLIQLAWRDYKSHVGPYAGLDREASDNSSLFSFGGTSVFSRESLSLLLPGRRRSSIGRVVETGEPPPRRRSLWR